VAAPAICLTKVHADLLVMCGCRGILSLAACFCSVVVLARCGQDVAELRTSERARSGRYRSGRQRPAPADGRAGPVPPRNVPVVLMRSCGEVPD
jgi:hypothetical protein